MDLLLQSATSLYTLFFGTLIPFILVLTILVFVHEMGHFLVARWTGVAVDTFSIGFGRELIGRTDRHGTRWRISAIPLGGYVRFIDDANAASVGGAAPAAAHLPGAFHSQPLWARAAVVIAGPLANFLLAIVIYTALFSAFGRPMTPPRIDKIEVASAAQAAGFQPGDWVKAIDGTPIESFSDIQRIVSLSTGEALQFQIDRNGSEVKLIATPERKEMTDRFGNRQKIGMLGIRHEGADQYLKSYSVSQASLEAVKETWAVAASSLSYVRRVIIGRESGDQLGGTLRVAEVTGQVATLGLIASINLLAVLSISIGLLNLFPVPMLDGGHLAYYFVEMVRGKPLSMAVQQFGMKIGFALVMALMVFATWNDVTHLLGL